MVEEDKGLADDACQETDWAIYAISAEFEVTEAASLQGAELRIYSAC